MDKKRLQRVYKEVHLKYFLYYFKYKELHYIQVTMPRINSDRVQKYYNDIAKNINQYYFIQTKNDKDRYELYISS